MKDFYYYEALTFITIFIFVFLFELKEKFFTKDKNYKLEFNTPLIIGFLVSLVVTYSMGWSLLQITPIFSMLLIYSLIILLFVLVLLKHIFKPDDLIFLSIFIYLSIYINLLYFNVHFDNKRFTQEEYRIVDKYKYVKGFKCKQDNGLRKICYKHYIKFCSDKNTQCYTWLIGKHKYENVYINKSITLNSHKGFFNVNWLEIDFKDYK